MFCIVLHRSASFYIVLRRTMQNGAEPNFTVLHCSPLFCTARCRTMQNKIYKYIVYKPAFRVQVSFGIVLHCWASFYIVLHRSTSCCAERCRTVQNQTALFCIVLRKRCRTMQNKIYEYIVYGPVFRVQVSFCIVLHCWVSFSIVLHRSTSCCA